MSATKSKKLLSLIIAAVFAMTSIAVFMGTAEKANAEEVQKIEPSQKVLYYPKDKNWNEWTFADSKAWIIDMSTATSSNPAVAVVKDYTDTQEGVTYYSFYVKKVGKTTLSFKAKAVGTDAWAPKTIKVNAYAKYVCPVKTFKVGKKNYAAKFKTRDGFPTTKKVSGKVNIKTKKGWKLKNIYIHKADGKEKKVKNKKKVTLKKGETLDATFKKGKTEIICSIWAD